MKAAENYHVSEQYVTRGVLPSNLFRHARKDFVLFNAMLFLSCIFSLYACVENEICQSTIFFFLFAFFFIPFTTWTHIDNKKATKFPINIYTIHYESGVRLWALFSRDDDTERLLRWWWWWCVRCFVCFMTPKKPACAIYYTRSTTMGIDTICGWGNYRS